MVSQTSILLIETTLMFHFPLREVESYLCDMRTDGRSEWALSPDRRAVMSLKLSNAYNFLFSDFYLSFVVFTLIFLLWQARLFLPPMNAVKSLLNKPTAPVRTLAELNARAVHNTKTRTLTHSQGRIVVLGSGWAGRST